VEGHVLTITLYLDHKYNSNTDSRRIRMKMETLYCWWSCCHQIIMKLWLYKCMYIN